MKTTGWNVLCGFFLVLALAGCNGYVQQKHISEVTELSRDDFTTALRWKQYQVAASHMQAEFRQEFIKTFTAFKDDLHISDVREVAVQTFEAGRRIETIVEMDYYLLPSVTVKTFSFDQIWVYTEESDTSEESFLIVTPFPEFP